MGAKALYSSRKHRFGLYEFDNRKSYWGIPFVQGEEILANWQLGSSHSPSTLRNPRRFRALLPVRRNIPTTSSQ